MNCRKIRFCNTTFIQGQKLIFKSRIWNNKWSDVNIWWLQAERNNALVSILLWMGKKNSQFSLSHCLWFLFEFDHRTFDYWTLYLFRRIFCRCETMGGHPCCARLFAAFSIFLPRVLALFRFDIWRNRVRQDGEAVFRSVAVCFLAELKMLTDVEAADKCCRHKPTITNCFY